MLLEIFLTFSGSFRYYSILLYIVVFLLYVKGVVHARRASACTIAARRRTVAARSPGLTDDSWR